MKSGDLVKIWLGVLFENSIVCHVFYAMVPWGCAWLCVVFWGLFCFGLPGPAFLLWGWVGPGLVFWTVVLTVALAWLHALLCGVGWGLLVLFGEFDPGSGRTLAACLTHASRTVKGPACWFWMSGERVSNT